MSRGGGACREGFHRRGEVGRNLAEWDKTAEAAGGHQCSPRIRRKGRDEDRPSHDLVKPGLPPPGDGLATREQRGDDDDRVVGQRYGIVGDQGLPVAMSHESDGAIGSGTLVLDERVWRGTVRDDKDRCGVLASTSSGTDRVR